MAQFFSCEEAAEVAKCSKYAIREAIKNGELKAYKPTRNYVIAADDLEAWIRKRAVKPTAKKGGGKNG